MQKSDENDEWILTLHKVASAPQPDTASNSDAHKLHAHTQKHTARGSVVSMDCLATKAAFAEERRTEIRRMVREVAINGHMHNKRDIEKGREERSNVCLCEETRKQALSAQQKDETLSRKKNLTTQPVSWTLSVPSNSEDRPVKTVSGYCSLPHTQHTPLPPTHTYTQRARECNAAPLTMFRYDKSGRHKTTERARERSVPC